MFFVCTQVSSPSISSTSSPHFQYTHPFNKMVSLTMIAPALAFALPALAGSYGDLCEQDPYCSYAPLSAYPKAKSYCSKYHEMAGYLPTPTTTLTATNTIYETVTAATVTKATTTGTVQSEVTIMSTDTTTNVILSATGRLHSLTSIGMQEMLMIFQQATLATRPRCPRPL